MSITTPASQIADERVNESLSRLGESDLFIQNAGFVDGEWRNGNKSFAVYEPSTGQVMGQAADYGVKEIRVAIEGAARAQPEYYSHFTAAARGQLLRKWHNLMMENHEELATILCLENGKTITEARGEITYAASFIAWFAEEAPRAYGDTIPSSTPNTMVMTLKEPVGVCGIITPWNFPAAMITRKVAPPLAAGCAVVMKPPSETPFTCLALTKLALDAGVPTRVVQACPTKDRQAASELASNHLVQKISFTGSTNVGKQLAKLAAGTLKKVSLELGGNAPFIVFQDADIDLAVEGAMMSKFRCSGQTCVCTNRIYVHRSVMDTFTEKLVKKVAELKLGAGLQESSTQGPLINAAAVKKVKQHIEDAVAKGGQIHIGGHTPGLRGYFIEPTVISGVTGNMAVASEETFGPLAPIFPFDTEEQVIALANRTEYGLAGYFYSRDVGRVLRMAQMLQVGMCGVNTGKISAAESPFGGIKESGYGLEGSKYGMAEYQVVKSLTIGNIHRSE